MFGQEQLTVPGSLRDLFSDHFSEHTRALISDPEQSQSQRSKTERYARACEILITLHGVGWNLKIEDTLNHYRVVRLLTPPSHLSEALLWIETGLGTRQFVIRLDVFIDYILSQGPIPIMQVHQWHLQRVFGEIKNQSLIDVGERRHKGLWKALLGISKIDNLSLQESVAIWIFREYFSQKVAESTNKSYCLDHSLADPSSPFQVPLSVRASKTYSSPLLINDRSNPIQLWNHSCLLYQAS